MLIFSSVCLLLFFVLHANQATQTSGIARFQTDISWTLALCHVEQCLEVLAVNMKARP